MTNNRINTDLSNLVSALKEKDRIRLTDAALMLELSENETEILVKKLADYGILEIHYSLKGHKTLKRGARIAEARETVEGAYQKHPISEETEKAFNIMRHMIAEKKGRSIQKAVLSENDMSKNSIDYERQKRLQEIKEGLISVRENLERIRGNLETDLKNRHESYNAQTDSELIRAN
jgi:hypothetical protein